MPAAQVLVDEGKRETYDVYGKQGLAAGLTVATYTGGLSRDQQRAEWAEFQRRNAQRPGERPSAGLDDRMASRGSYVIRVRAVSTGVPRMQLAVAEKAWSSMLRACLPGRVGRSLQPGNLVLPASDALFDAHVAPSLRL